MFKRKIEAERILLMLPLNVVMVGRIRGDINPSKVSAALEFLRQRHPLLAVRVKIDGDGTGWYVAEDVPRFTPHFEQRQHEDQWIARVKEEFRTPFPIETGPLVRCALIHSSEVSEIILCGHHAICDGMSLGYLLRDLLQLLTEPKQGIGKLIDAPTINATTVPKPPTINSLYRCIMDRVNRQWAKKSIRFGETEMRRMHEVFWQQNSQVQVLAWTLDTIFTAALVKRCRIEDVTVNTALWTAFLAAQDDVQGHSQRYRQHSALTVNIRDKLAIYMGDAFGFYASSLSVNLPYSAAKSFWDNARKIHAIISNALVRTNLFRMLSAELIHPTLLDALYFSKYGLLDEAMPKRLLHKMGWHKVTYGYAITNVGRFDIPTVYGPLTLEAVYGPAVYSDVDEKVVGVITVAGQLSGVLTCNAAVVDDATRLRNVAMAYLQGALKAKA